MNLNGIVHVSSYDQFSIQLFMKTLKSILHKWLEKLQVNDQLIGWKIWETFRIISVFKHYFVFTSWTLVVWCACLLSMKSSKICAYVDRKQRVCSVVFGTDLMHILIFTISISLVSDVPGRLFWDGEETHSSILAQGSVNVHNPPMEERRGALEEDSYRTNPQESASAPT